MQMSKITTFPYELIGEEIEVVVSPNNGLIGIKGKVVDESKNTLTIESEGVMKKLLKRAIKFKLLKTGKIILGNDIVKRSEERIKGK
jgi:ribonuclease P protein subunit POP4